MITFVNAFPFGLPYKRHRRPPDFHNVFDFRRTRPVPERTGLVGAKIRKNPETCKHFGNYFVTLQSKPINKTKDEKGITDNGHCMFDGRRGAEGACI
jgi:hypothetical protein